MSTTSTITRERSVSEWTEKFGVSLSAKSLEPIEKFSGSRLKPHRRAVAQLVQSANEDSENFGSKTLDEFLAVIKAGLLQRVNEMKSAIMSHPNFRRLEAAHAAVEERVFQEDGQGLKVRVMNVRLDDLRDDFAEAGKADKSHTYRSLVASEYHRPGGQCNHVVHLLHPVGPDEKDVIENLLSMAEESHFVVLGQAKPGVVCPEDPITGEPPDDFSSLPRDPEELAGEYAKPENAPLRSLQQEGRATKLLLACGQAIGRRPYDPEKNPAVGSPAFRESNGPLYLPVSSLASRSIASSYTRHDNGSRISGYHDGGKHTRPSVIVDDEVMTLDCVIDELQDMALQRCGLYAALPWKGKDFAVAFDTPSAFVPESTGDAQKDADARLSSRLAYTLLGIELGHKLKRELRYARGSAITEADMETHIRNKFELLVTPDANAAENESLARKPLKSVEVTLTSPSPGCFVATVAITPHTLMAEAHATLRLKAELGPKNS